MFSLFLVVNRNSPLGPTPRESGSCSRADDDDEDENDDEDEDEDEDELSPII